MNLKILPWIAALAICLSAALFGITATADAHRVPQGWAQIYANNEVQYECGRWTAWYCWEARSPLISPCGDHSWCWDGVYITEIFGPGTRRCRSVGRVYHDYSTTGSKYC